MAIPISKALRIDPSTRLALVGAGGKTGLMFQLARELPGPVFVTATTHLSTTQITLAGRHFFIDTPDDVPVSRQELSDGINLFTGSVTEAERTSGLKPVSLERLRSLADRLHAPLLIEADGARRLPLKAPASHEPPVPDFVDTVVVVAGLSGLGKPLTSEWVHRPEIFSDLSGAAIGDPVTPEKLMRVILHPDGGMKNIPAGARRIVVLNQADTPEMLRTAQEMAGKPYSNQDGLLSGFHAVLVCKSGTAEAVFEPAAGIILAGGEAKRWREGGGTQPKQVISVGGKPLVRRAAELALTAGLSPVIVVTGANADEIGRAVAGLGVTLVNNPEWSQGMSTSMKTGLQVVPEETQAVVFLLADQPFVPVEVVQGLVEIHARHLVQMAAPTVLGKRTNPTLFDRSLFPELLKITGDEGGRSLFRSGSPYSSQWLEWNDGGVFADIDTLDDFEALSRDLKDL